MVNEEKFYESCRDGDLDSLDLLESYNDVVINKGIEISFLNSHYKLITKLILHLKDPDLSNYLIGAVESGDLAMVKAFCSSEIDLFEPSDLNNPLVSCMEEENWDIFEFLYTFLDQEQKNILLSIAVQLNFFKFVEYLLEQKEITPLYNYQGKNALKYAIRKSNIMSLKILLKDSRVKVDFEDLEQASRKERGDVMALLLSYYPNDLVQADLLIENASKYDHREVLDVLFHDLRINPWNIKSSSVNIKQILEKAKAFYGTLDKYLARYKLYENYFESCDFLTELEESYQELLFKHISRTNLGHDYLVKCLEKTRYTICDLKKQLGLLC